MTAVFEAKLPADPGPERKAPEPQGPLASTLSSLIQVTLTTSQRALQTEVGASEVGHPCPRRLAYRMAGAAKSNHGDPMALLIGLGVHSILEDTFLHLDRGSGRFIVEPPIVYRDILGRADLLDTWLHTLIDWKTTTKSTLAKYVKGGPPQIYRVQAFIYAAALQDQGYEVERIAITFLPRDGALSQLWCWETKPDRGEADRFIDRLRSIAGQDPAEVRAVPDRLCGQCPFYNPRSTDLSLACPGPGQQQGGK